MPDRVLLRSGRFPEHLSATEFQNEFQVSRETLERLEIHWRLLEKWQPRINLVGKGALSDPWRRHYLDSAQLMPLGPTENTRWVDAGSGAGFPGLVLAILGIQYMTLVEADSRKCAFLREAARETGTAVDILNCRLESTEVPTPGVIVSRALAPLSKLLTWSEHLFTPSLVALFLKGQNVDMELTEAAKSWRMDCEHIPSRSSSSGVILRMKGFRRV